MSNSRKRHGHRIFVLPNEETIADELDFVGEAPPPAPQAALPPDGRSFRFIRMFPDLESFRPPRDGLIELGAAMEAAGQGADHPALPAGFTYLGQFIDHDITLDATSDLAADTVDPADLEQGRSPATDLDSVYLRGPALSPELYEDDQLRLRVGTTTGTSFGGGNASDVFPNDLPRGAGGKAIIGDGRNDENLAVAQTHLAFLKFHNAVVDDETLPSDFQAVRDLVTRHYQSILWHDFLPRIVDDEILQAAEREGRRVLENVDARPAMPIEFSVAAYRLGHSMVRDEYEWNRVFETPGPGPVANLGLVFKFSEVSGDLGGEQTLPSNWIIDWTRFYDFSGEPRVDSHPRSNSAHRLDTQLAGLLKNLPEFARTGIPEHLLSLATRNLLRGRLLGLPSGQAVAQKLSVPALTPAQMRDSKHAAILERHGFDAETPLWYYILLEAELLHAGLRLGPVGSTIVVETFHSLIEGSRVSIFEDGWSPKVPHRGDGRFRMTDLLAYVDDLNPLGA